VWIQGDISLALGNFFISEWRDLHNISAAKPYGLVRAQEMKKLSTEWGRKAAEVKMSVAETAADTKKMRKK
jgi:hypothetical protein